MHTALKIQELFNTPLDVIFSDLKADALAGSREPKGAEVCSSDQIEQRML